MVCPRCGSKYVLARLGGVPSPGSDVRVTDCASCLWTNEPIRRHRRR
jgi:hypothetical protein